MTMKIESRKEETKAVREALKAVGINAKVSHGRGTAWGWLEINIGNGQQWGEHDRAEGHIGQCSSICERCKNMKAMMQQTTSIVRGVTGRQGEYDGNTLILAQDHWSDAKGERVPIEHPSWTRPQAKGRTLAEAI